MLPCLGASTLIKQQETSLDWTLFRRGLQIPAGLRLQFMAHGMKADSSRATVHAEY